MTLPPKTRPHPPGPGEGITLTVLNQRHGSLIFHKVFPLRVYWAHWADLDWHLQHIAPGRIVVIAVAVSGIFGLRQATLRLAALGSLFARHLPPSAHWTWVFVKGGRTISETALTHAHLPHHAHTLLPLSHLPDQRTTSPRWQYCGAHAVMGGLCDEVEPDPLPTPTPPPIANQTHLAKVPIIVTAGTRYQYLYHTLTTLLATPGAIHHNVLVVLGDAPPSTTLLLRLLNLNFTTLAVHGHHNDKLFRYYRSVFNLVASTFPDAPAAIFLDEDVEVSPDFFSYFSQTLWLLHEDPTLYCINAHSATGFSRHAYQPSRVFRGSVQVQWGYAVSLDFVREALQMWPHEKSDTGIVIYDYWLYKVVRCGRECLFPEVSRTLHYGTGTNADAYTVERAFLDKPLLREAGVTLAGVDKLLLSNWRKDLTHNISQAIQITGNPCTSDFVPLRLSHKRHYVFYYRLDEDKEGGVPDMTQALHLHECLGAWSLSEQGQHQGVTIVTLSARTLLYLVGVPYSPYSHLWLSHLPLWDINNIPENEFLKIEEKWFGHQRFTPVLANTNVTLADFLHILSTP